MPLIQSGSEEAFKQNVATEIEHGHPQKQAVAIAYETQRANDDEMPNAPMVVTHDDMRNWGK